MFGSKRRVFVTIVLRPTRRPIHLSMPELALVAGLCLLAVVLGSGSMVIRNTLNDARMALAERETLVRKVTAQERLLQAMTDKVAQQDRALQEMAEKALSVDQYVAQLRDLESEIRKALDRPETAAKQSPPYRSGANGAGGPVVPGSWPDARTDAAAAETPALAQALRLESLLGDLRASEVTLQEWKQYLAHRPIGWPAVGRITDSFGWRTSPFTGRREWHGGLDIATTYPENYH